MLLLYTAHAGATTVDGRFVVLTNNGSTYSVKVQIKVDAAKDMGGATLQFTYNTGNLSYPNTPSSGTHYSFSNFTGGSYGTATVTKTSANGNTLSLNIELLVDNAGSTVGTAWMDVATLNFTTANAAGGSSLAWSLIEVCDEDNATQWNNGSWSDLNTTPLPVELLAFSGRYDEGVTALRWSTASELNNLGFVIERSGDGIRWDSISFVQGHFSTDRQHDYTAFDIVPGDLRTRSTLWYRLRQIDRDGSMEHSQAVSVVLPTAVLLTTLHAPYPNPTTGITTLSYTLAEAQSVTLLVIDGSGREVWRHAGTGMPAAGHHTVQFDGRGLPAGVYHAVLTTARGSNTQRLLLTQ